MIVNPGSTNSPPPLPPPLNFARVEILAPDMSLLAAADNVAAGSGTPVSLLGLQLTADGITTSASPPPARSPAPPVATS